MMSRFNIRQVVPPERCLSCDVCCRFPEKDSFLAPYFTREEIVAVSAILNSPLLGGVRGDEKSPPLQGEGQGGDGLFSDEKPESGCKITLIPYKEGYICPAFNPQTSHCKVYDLRPIDCRLYPFAVIWDASGKEILLGLDSKCPYVAERREYPILRVAAAEVASAIESEPLIDIFASNRGLIGPYQNDVISWVVLKRLTDLIAYPPGVFND